MLESKRTGRFIRQVAPSSVFHNGTDVVFTVSRRLWTSLKKAAFFKKRNEVCVSSPPVSWDHAAAGRRRRVGFEEGQEGQHPCGQQGGGAAGTSTEV